MNLICSAFLLTLSHDDELNNKSIFIVNNNNSNNNTIYKMPFPNFAKRSENDWKNNKGSAIKNQCANEI